MWQLNELCSDPSSCRAPQSVHEALVWLPLLVILSPSVMTPAKICNKSPELIFSINLKRCGIAIAIPTTILGPYINEKSLLQVPGEQSANYCLPVSPTYRHLWCLYETFVVRRTECLGFLGCDSLQWEPPKHAPAYKHMRPFYGAVERS